MSLTFKLASLAIRTVAKPVANYIKKNARDHDGFRKFCINQAQVVHRIDMRMRLGILHDQAAQDRMHARAQAEADAKKRAAETPTVKAEAEQKKFEEEAAKADREGKDFRKEEKAPKVKIRPLSEAKAIELGANFFSEAFIFAVAAGLLVLDSWRSRRKENARRGDVSERLESLESELETLRLKYEPNHVREEKSKEEPAEPWYNPAGWWTRTEPQAVKEAESEHMMRVVEAEMVSKPEHASSSRPSEKGASAAPFAKATKAPPKAEPEMNPTDAPVRLETVETTKK